LPSAILSTAGQNEEELASWSVSSHQLQHLWSIHNKSTISVRIKSKAHIALWRV